MVSSAVCSLADVTSETVAALWAKIYGNVQFDEKGRGMLVCKVFHELLPPLITSIGSYPLRTQESFERFARTYRHLADIYFEPKCGDNPEALDWSKVSFPNLKSLTLYICAMKSFEFSKANTPSLERLTIGNEGQKADEIRLDLPELTHLDIQYCQLEGLGNGKQRLHLPSCTSLYLDNCDLSWLEIHAPKLNELCVQICHDLEHVRLHPAQAGVCDVNLINTNFDKQTLWHFTAHERVGPAVRVGHVGDMLDDYPGPHMGRHDEWAT